MQRIETGFLRRNPVSAFHEIKQAIFRGAGDDALLAESCLIAVTPVGEFVTYGIGIPLSRMRFPEQARGRAPVNGS